MTVERVLLTKWPVTARSKMTRKGASIASIAMCVLCLGTTTHAIFTAEIKTPLVNGTEDLTQQQCIVSHGKMTSFYTKTWPVLVLMLFNAIPMFIVLLGNLTIIVTIISQRRRMRQVNPASRDQQQTAPNKIKSATKMLFLISTMFLLTTFPFTVGNVILSLQKPNTQEQQARQQLVYSILRNILYCNFTFNFVLYFLSGTLFKQEWKALLKDVRQKLTTVFTSTTSESQNTMSTSNQSNQPDT